MIRLHLQAPILPEGAELTAELQDTDDISFVAEAVNAAYVEAEKSGASRNTIRTMAARFDALQKEVHSLLPSMAKLNLANKREGGSR